MSNEYQAPFTLPTRGLIYDNIPDGKVVLESIGTKEEKIIASRSGNAESIVTALLRRCMTLPDPEAKIDPQQLAVVDRVAAMMKIRVMSYGGDYGYQYKCEDCDGTSRGTIDLETLPFLEAKDGFGEPYYVDLPLQKKKVGLRLLRGVDQEAISKYSKKKYKKGFIDEGDPAYIYRLALVVTDVDEEELDLPECITFVESLKGKDSLAIRDTMDDIKLGYDMEVLATCPQCGFDNEFILPIGSEFFRPRRNRPED